MSQTNLCSNQHFTSSLKGKTVYFLGSSVTRGHGGDTDGKSFVEYIAQDYGILYEKEAVSGTTLAVRKDRSDSYVQRVDNFSFHTQPIAVIIQLSTNDFVSTSSTAANTRSDVTHSIKTVTQKIREKCPNAKIAFYICPLADSLPFYRQYNAYACFLKTILSTELSIDVIDLTTAKITLRQEHLQPDGLHPTACGYREIFTPAIADYLRRIEHNL